MPNILVPKGVAPGLSFSALDLITAAMRTLGALSFNELPEGAEAQDCLGRLNRMLDGWNSERLMIFSIANQQFEPSVLKQVYTLGSGGDFDMPRPPKLEAIGLVINPQNTIPTELRLDDLTWDEWQSIVAKAVSSAFPTGFWNDTGFPLMNLNFWPIPQSQVAYRLYYWQALNAFNDLATLYAFPPAYAEALEYNLAVRLGPVFQHPISPDIAGTAIETKAKIKRINYTPEKLTTDYPAPANRLVYNWRTDQFGRP